MYDILEAPQAAAFTRFTLIEPARFIACARS
jgi:hypothetical protein